MVRQKITQFSHIISSVIHILSLPSHDFQLEKEIEISLPPNSEIFNSWLPSLRDVIQISSFASFIPMLIYKSEDWAKVWYVLESFSTFQYVSLKTAEHMCHDLITHHQGVTNRGVVSFPLLITVLSVIKYSKKQMIGPCPARSLHSSYGDHTSTNERILYLWSCKTLQN